MGHHKERLYGKARRVFVKAMGGSPGGSKGLCVLARGHVLLASWPTRSVSPLRHVGFSLYMLVIRMARCRDPVTAN